MTLPETAFKGNQQTLESSKTPWILAILLLTASASFGLGMLAQKDLGNAISAPITGQGGPNEAVSL